MTDDTADAGPPIDPFDARTVSLHGTGDPSSAGGTTAAGRAVPAMPSDPSAIAGFTLLDVIGGGGSGLVMSAEQHRPRRRVAVKFLHRRVGDPIARARFESEADLLARVDHPSIARVFAAGVLAGAPDEPDQPWIAMELVEGGRPITRWADESNLDRAARVRLMEEACEAVHHAHQRGVIHRDLKPANMLVDREGRLRLIDFGIAVDEKDDAAPPASPDGLPLSERPDAAVAGPTTTVGLIGTPGYMSPEQFDGGRDAVDVRTDGYALGVVLFELVTGRLPHAVDEAAADGLLERKRAAATSPASVDPTVDPDLDAVIRTAIAPRREDRYAAVSELADELERWRRGAFVDARPPARPERIGRFVRHHRGAVALSAGGLLLLVAGAGLVTGLWLRSSRALDDLAASQAAEQAQRDRTAAIEEELASLQAAMNEGLPATASTNDGDGTITWPQLLVGDVGKEILEDSAPLVLSAAGDVLEEITDQLSEAESSLERRTLIRSATEQIAALERRIGGSATSDPRLGLQLARTYRTLGDLQGVEWMAGRDDVEPSVPAYRRAAEIIDALRERSPRNPELARASAATNIDLAQALRKIGEFDEAERVARGAVAASEGLLADGNARFAEGRLLVSSLWAQTDAIIGLPRNDEGVATSMEALSRSRSLRGLFGDRPDALSAVAWSALRAGIWSARAERDADVASPILDEGINAVLRWVDAAPEDREPFVAWAAIIGSEHRIIVESPGERSATEAIAVRLQQLSAWYDAPIERADLDDDAAATLAERRRGAHQRMALSLLEVVREGAVSGFSPIASPSDPTALSASDRELAVAIAERMADVVDEMNQAEEAWVIEETGRFARDARARRGRGSDRRTMDRAAALIVDLDPELAARLGDPRAAAGPARGRLPRGEQRPRDDR